MKGLIMYPQTALQALHYLKSLPDCDFIDFLIERECHGAAPYLSAKTREGQWIIAWHVDELGV
jgi:hypothetical protein